MTQARRTEKRQYPRIEQRLPLKIAANGYDFTTSTHNVSCVGLYCRVEKYIPPFTRIMVKLNLPVAGSRGNDTCDVECRGVVVRTDDEKEGGFNIAVFFNQINDNQRQKISHYIDQFLPEKSSVS
jgi:hypothetical protein